MAFAACAHGRSSDQRRPHRANCSQRFGGRLSSPTSDPANFGEDLYGKTIEFANKRPVCQLPQVIAEPSRAESVNMGEFRSLSAGRFPGIRTQGAGVSEDAPFRREVSIEYVSDPLFTTEHFLSRCCACNCPPRDRLPDRRAGNHASRRS